MKTALLLAALISLPTWAQVPPNQYHRDQRANGNDYELTRQWTEHERRREHREHRRWCRQWERRVQEHPRLIFPRECYRYRSR